MESDEIRVSVEELPKLKYGYRDTPLSWADLHQIVNVECDIDKLCRNIPQQLAYEEFKLRTLKKWKSMHDFVLCTKLGVGERFDEELNKLSACGKSLTAKQSTGDLLLVHNDFPYCMEPHIEHWILWKLGGDCISEEEIIKGEEDLKVKHGTESEFIVWENPPRLRSLPGIDHVHILCCPPPT